MRQNHFSESLSDDIRNKWDEFRIAAEHADILPQHDPEVISELKRAFAFSDFIAKTCIREPQIPNHLISSGDILRQYAPNELNEMLRTSLSHVKDDAELSTVLRCHRRREMVRIAWRDLAGWADLSETMTDLSALADACIGQALSLLFKWHCSSFGVPVGKDGFPQCLIVLGMGKLGARELNFSSDIDLIFAYPEAGETKKPVLWEKPEFPPMSNDEFFVRLCRQLIKMLGANTSDGIVFRVDMGLRPYGESGPIVMSFDALESYYQMQGREWERYAWIKARVSGGDKVAGARLLERLNPFVYRRYLDYGVFESLREMKQKISLEVRRKGMKDNIKLGPGGIREVEFFGQIFQLIRGGCVAALQERGIQRVLKILAQEGHIPQSVCDELDKAYIFLRNTEHRLQEFSDQQTQKLPPDPVGRERLALSMGFENWESFFQHLEYQMETVHHHFKNLLETKTSDTQDGNEMKEVWQNLSEDERVQKMLAAAGFDNPEEVIGQLMHLKDDLGAVALTREGRERIDKLIPLVLKDVGRSGSALALSRIIDLIRSIKRRTSYISLLLENSTALTHLVRLANASSWILSFLASHPVLLDELLDPRRLYLPPKKPDLEAEIRHRFEQMPQQDLEYQMDELRIFKQVNTLRVSAADITEALPLMKVSDHLSNIAETVLNEVVELARAHLIEIHGTPVCRFDGVEMERGFAVIAYGKLGGLELGYASDLDLVFLHAGTHEETQGGERPIDSSYFFGRMGQRVIHILTAHTSAGILYDADMRLRPSGRSGVLVCHINTFEEYQLKEAWTWEKQALIKARFVSGNAALANQFETIRKQVLAQARDEAELREEVIQMRLRMKKELLKPEPGIFDLKQGIGGMVDIEFLVQYLVLLKSHEHPELLRWPDNVRLIGTLAETGIIDDITAYFLRKAYLTYRTVGHRLSLQDKPAKVPDTKFLHLRKKVEDTWNVFLGNSS